METEKQKKKQKQTVQGGTNSNSGKPPEILIPGKEDLLQIDPASLDIFLPVLTSVDLASQVDQLKLLIREKVVEKEANHQIASIVLVQWYFNTGLKSSVRKVIANSLNNIKDLGDLGNLVSEQISVHLTKVCQDSELKSESEFIKKILLCFDNFNLGAVGVLSSTDVVTRFLVGQLEFRIENICEEDISPVDKASQTDEASDAMRAIVHMVRGSLDKLDWWAEISLLSYRILCQQDLPLDLRTNAGIIYVYIERAKCVETIEDQIEQISTFSKTNNGKFELSNPGSIICLLHGVLSNFNTVELDASQKEHNLLLNIVSCYLKVAHTDKDTGTILGHSRGMLSWSSKLVEYCKANSTAALLRQVQKETFEYVWCHLEHSVDSVKHSIKHILRNLIAAMVFGLTDGGQGLLDQLLTDTIKLPIHKKSRLASLSCLVRFYSVEEVIKSYPNIQSDILLLHTEYALVGQLSDLYNNILTAHHSNSNSVSDWFDTSVRPLIDLYSNHQSQAVTQFTTSLLKTAVKLNPSVIDLILGYDSGKGSNDKLGLCCLAMSRESGKKWDFTKHSSLLERTSCHLTDDIRLQAFRLIVDSHSTVETFSMCELDLLMQFIRDNLALQSPSSHQVFCTTVKKLLKRIKEGTASVSKKLTQKKFDLESRSLKAVIKSYNQFLEQLLVVLFGNLFPGANFPRRSAVLEILMSMQSIIGFSSTPILDISHSINPTTAQSLFECLHDSYEINKDRAIFLLNSIPPHHLQLHSPDHVSVMLDELSRLMSSNKPPDSVVAAGQIKLLLKAPALPWVLADKLSLLTSPQNKVKYFAAVHIRDQLVEQLSRAEQSLLDAAVDGPMYGTVSVLRSIYEEIDPTEFNEDWKQLTQDILSVCYNIWRVVGCVVANDSPEGHLPMDQNKINKILDKSLGANINGNNKLNCDNNVLFCAVFNEVVVSDVFPDEIAEEIIDEVVDNILGIPPKNPKTVDFNEETDLNNTSQETLNIDSVDIPEGDLSESAVTKAREVSSQMVLLCAWRSVKEVCLFLSQLCKTFSSTKSTTNIITVDQILDVASFLVDLLMETKHRGAFEQAYVAFSSLCDCLWKATLTELHSYPALMLQQVISNIGGSISNRVPTYGMPGKPSLCSTRRSAGVPFIIQAIVSTELQESAVATQGSTFRTAMTSLLNLADNHQAEAESRVHSLNILRALFRDSRLGDSVSTYVELGVRVAITGFKAANWAERNAATLLFSCLVTRIFGVKREKDTISAKNCLTGKVFFQRYPSLYQFLLNQLSECMTNSSSGKGSTSNTLTVDSSVFPVLLILSRIFPSPTEQLGNPYPLSAYLPYVESCLSSSILHTRQLAAKAMVPLIQTDQVDECICGVVSKLIEMKKTPQNTLHGLLLFLQEFLHRVPDMVSLMMDHILTLPLIELFVKENPCMLTCSVYTSISSQLLSSDPDTTVIADMRNSLVDRLLDEKENSNADPTMTTPQDVWKPLFFNTAARFVVKTSLSEGDIGLTTKLLVHSEYEVRKVVIELVSQHLEAKKEPQLPCQEIVSLLLCEKHPDCFEKLLRCCNKMDLCDLEQDQLPFLLSLIDSTENDDIKAAGISLTSHMIGCCLPSWASMLSDHLEKEQSLIIRKASAQALVENIKLLEVAPKNPEERKAWIVLWSCCLKLLLDDEECIRDALSHIVKLLTGVLVSPNLAGDKLIELMIGKVGRVVPSACILLCVGTVLTSLFENELEQSSAVSAENDRAFDKNEANLYEEIITLAMKMFTPLGKYVSKLSPKMQERAFCQDWPNELGDLLPELPGAVIVHNGIQLLEYLAARACVGLPRVEGVVMSFLFTVLRCPSTQQQTDNFFIIQKENMDTQGKENYFLKSALCLNKLKPVQVKS